MQCHNDRNASTLRVSRSFVGKRAHDSTMEVRDIDALVALSILDKGSAGGRSTRYRLVRR